MRILLITLLIALLPISLFSENYFNTAMSFYSNKEYKKAAIYFQKEIQENVYVNLDAFIYLLRSYNYIGKYEKMLKYSRRAIRITQSRYEFYYYKGLAHYKLQEYKESLHNIRRALSLRPASAYLYNYMGLVHLRLNENANAESAFHFAVSLNNRNAVYLNNLAVAIERQGRLKEAFTFYKEAFNLNPNYKHSRLNYTRLTNYFTKKGIAFTGLSNITKKDNNSSTKNEKGNVE